MITCHCYADDTQIYLSFCPNTPNEDYCISVLETCIKYIRAWMLQNKLMLNDRKTELLVIGTSRQVSKFKSNGISVGDTAIKPSHNVRNLGVLFDTQLNMESQIISVCKSAYYMIYNLRRIRKYFDQDSMKTVVHACITSKLDYCNSLLYGLPLSQIAKLQRVQNTCARLICNLPKFAHVIPLLKELHWLPVRQRIEFKMLMIVYKALHGQAPSYIIELLNLKFQTHGHNLRSTQDTLALQIPQIRTKVTLGDRSFYCAAPRLWNKLPVDIRKSQTLESFKSKVKTYLF